MQHLVACSFVFMMYVKLYKGLAEYHFTQSDTLGYIQLPFQGERE